MEKHKYKFKWGFSLNVEKLEKWMNDLSAKGMHVVKPGYFWNKVATDQTQQYVYQMDFQRELNTKQKMKEYKDLYKEGGWEYIGSIGPLWHYFRKNVSMGEPYKLYTDYPSLIDYYRRIRRVTGVILCANLTIAAFNITANGYGFMSFRFGIISVQVLLTIILMLSFVGLLQRMRQLQRDSGSEQELQ